VRFIGDPSQRIAEDYLRIPRFFRIHAPMAVSPIPRGARLPCLHRGASSLTTLSAERVRMENAETDGRGRRARRGRSNGGWRVTAADFRGVAYMGTVLQP